MSIFRRKPEYVASVQVLALGPNDRLVIEHSLRMSEMEAQDIRDEVAKFAGIDSGRVLVVSNATVRVLREFDPPPPPVILAPGRAS